MSKHEKFNYLEFPTTDIQASKDFFTDVFAWSFEDYGPDYTAFARSEAGLDGGFFSAEVPSRTKNGATLAVLLSENLEQTRDKVSKAGGIIEQDIFSFPGGRRFHFIEPGGNEIAVWSQED